MKLTGYQIELCSVTAQDLSLLRKLEKRPRVSVNLCCPRNRSLKSNRLAWFNKIQRDDTQHHFVIYYKSQPIGSANIKSRGINVPLKQAPVVEPGLYIGVDKYRNNLSWHLHLPCYSMITALTLWG